MCGIAGIIDLSGGRRPVPGATIRAMADAIVHRGPDEDGYLERPGLAFASRRLSIVGLNDGRQPISNEDGSVSVVFNGELFDYREMKPQLEARGHVFRTHCDTEIIPHVTRIIPTTCSPTCAASSPSLSMTRNGSACCWARSLRHLPALLEPQAGRLAAVRLRDQGDAGVRHGGGESRAARVEPAVHLLLPAGAVDLLQGRAVSTAGALPAH